MNSLMRALVYEAPFQMHMREVPTPTIQADEVLIRIAYSGICGSELNGFEGKNAIRKPPLIMGHEFSGVIEQVGAGVRRDDLRVGMAVTANPMVTCGVCEYCLSGRQQLCPARRLMSAHLPGSNAEFLAVPAGQVYTLPEGMDLTTAALAEPAAVVIHAAEMAAPKPHEIGLVIGAGTIGLLLIQALQAYGLRTIYCADLNRERLAMAESLGALAWQAEDGVKVDLAVDAVGTSVPRQLCVRAARPGGRVIFVGNHDAETALPVTDMVRQEIACFGTYTYTPLEFGRAITALADGSLRLPAAWTRIEPLEHGTVCFEELMVGSPVAKIWLKPG